MGKLILLAAIIVFGIGLFFSIWGLAFMHFEGGYEIKNSALPTGMIILFAAILIFRKYKSDKHNYSKI